MAVESSTAAHELPVEQRVLLMPPTHRDAEAIRRVFEGCGIDCWTYDAMPELCRDLEQGAAAVVVSEEALFKDPGTLFNHLRSQPVWADLPIIVLSRSGSESPKLSELLEKAGNVSVLERPVRISTFLSIVRVAIRGRTKQYEVREHLKQIEAVEAARTSLWESERAARAEAERAGRMKDEFLATLSHELRTPLNAILGWTHILSRSARRDEELEKGLAVIDRNARAQSQIVADLLDMNRIINGRVRLDVQRVRLATVVQSAVDTVVPMADAKDIRLDAALDRPIGVVRGDPERLQQVFWNLLTNAVKFTPKGGQIHVMLARVDDELEVTVEDTGEGIGTEALPHIFDRFRQVDGSTTRRHGGLGLGLAIVKQLVELHGGSVRVRSRGPGKGSSFTVALPLAPDRDVESAILEHGRLSEDAGASRFAPSGDVAGVRVLIVDDEPDSQDLVKRLLEDAGARVTTAGSASEALTLIERERPDVLVSDVGMPGQDGYSLLRTLRARPVDQGGATVAVALTAYARPEDRAEAMRAGFQYHISKPLEPAALLSIVASAAGRTPGR